MDKKMQNLPLQIVIHILAAVVSWKPKSKILHMILECIYCVAISVFPVLFISFYIMPINRNESVDFGIVMGCVSILVVGPLVYFVIANRREEKKIEDYFLSGALYIEAYINDKSQIKRRNSILIAEIIHFLLLLLGFWSVIRSLLEELEIWLVDTSVISIVIGLFLAYVLFVYGKCDKAIRQRRKAILGVCISLIWLLVVGIRINHYLRDMTQIGLEDMLILFFSAVFTIPTIYEWVKNIPAKLVEPYSKRVYERREEILKEHSREKEKYIKRGIQFLDGLKEGIKLIVFKWKNGEKKRVITSFFCIFVVAIIMFIMIWSGNIISLLLDKLVECVKVGYANLNYGTQEIVYKIVALLFLIGIMLRLIFVASGNYAAKKNRVEKI